MKELFLNGAEWKTSDDVYDAFFKAVGAPSWHSRNFNALNDSIATGNINDVEVPYCVVIQNYSQIGAEAKKIADDFIDLVHEIGARGCPVEIRTEAEDTEKRSRD
jgi:RNAse (barnase) inhibitor barstar